MASIRRLGVVRSLAVGGVVAVAIAAAASVGFGQTESSDPGWIATSPAPGARQGELTLVPHPGSDRALVFQAGTPIHGHLRTADPLSSPSVPIALRLFRSDPVEGQLMTWGDAVTVTADQVELDFELAGQEPGTYRLVAYHAMTEPLAVLDLVVDGEQSALPSAPAVPPDWQTVRSMSGDLVLQLPPDFGAVLDWSSVVANPPPDGAAGWISLIAESPAGTDQPSTGTSLADWLAKRWFAGDRAAWSPAVTQGIRLPAGEAVQLTRSTLEENSWSAILYAIPTPNGVGFLVIDGPADQMQLRASELELIPKLLSYP